MAVSKHIIDLVNLALQDRVLTFTERQTIVQTAINEGVSEAEINAVLDNMLAQRLKSYSKEQLKRCPSCGAQIPLLSEDCFFCGAKLEKSAPSAVPPPYNVTGADADIIRAENIRTEQEEINIKNCPDCGAPFPLMSNVCTHCGHVLHARRESEFNIKNLITKIAGSIYTMQNSYKPTFADVLKFNKGIMTLLLGLFCFMVGWSYPGDFGEIVTVGGFFVGLVGIMLQVFLRPENSADAEAINKTINLKKVAYFVSNLVDRAIDGAANALSKTNSVNTKHPNVDSSVSPVTAADEVYYQALCDHNMYIRLTKSIYGDNSEANNFISQLGAEIQKAEQIRRRNSNKLMLIVVSVIALGVILIMLHAAFTTYDFK